jgi:hypothetical protein
MRSAANGVPKGVIVFLCALAVFPFLWFFVPAFQKARADSLVRELCGKDGGMKVHEIVSFPKARFDQFGSPTFPGSGGLPPLKKEDGKTDGEFYFTLQTTWVWPESSWLPSVWRSEQRLYRQVDGKLLGQAVSYSRKGGDPIGPWHPSSFGCPLDADITVLVRHVFIVQR